jgi:hypothetical protein
LLAVTTSSLLGARNGASLLLHDSTRTVRLPYGRDARIGADDPQGHGHGSAVAAKSLPFLGITVMPLPSSRRVDAGRSGWLSDLQLSGPTVLFSILLMHEIRTQLA